RSRLKSRSLPEPAGVAGLAVDARVEDADAGRQHGLPLALRGQRERRLGRVGVEARVALILYRAEDAAAGGGGVDVRVDEEVPDLEGRLRPRDRLGLAELGRGQ